MCLRLGHVICTYSPSVESCPLGLNFPANISYHCRQGRPHGFRESPEAGKWRHLWSSTLRHNTVNRHNCDKNHRLAQRMQWSPKASEHLFFISQVLEFLVLSVNCQYFLFGLGKSHSVIWSLQTRTFVDIWFLSDSSVVQFILFLTYFHLNHFRDHLAKNHDLYFLNI